MRQPLIVCLCVAVSAMLSGNVAPTPAPGGLPGFLTREDVPLVSYRGTRRLEASNARFRKEGWLEAAVESSPERGFTFTVLEEGGSTYIRERVLRKALQTEAELVRAGDAARAALSPANYAFSEGTPTGTDTFTFRLRPLRSDKLLVDGHVTVSAFDGDLLLVQGQLARAPSFWTRWVHVVRRYGRLQGIRVPLVTESRAEVRVVGPSEFRMTTTYDEVNGIDVSGHQQTRESGGGKD